MGDSEQRRRIGVDGWGRDGAKALEGMDGRGRKGPGHACHHGPDLDSASRHAPSEGGIGREGDLKGGRA